MGKFAVKIERVITIALILSMMLILAFDNRKDKKDKKIRTPITHTNRKNAYMHKTGVNGNVLFKSRLYLWL